MSRVKMGMSNDDDVRAKDSCLLGRTFSRALRMVFIGFHNSLHREKLAHTLKLRSSSIGHEGIWH